MSWRPFAPLAGGAWGRLPVSGRDLTLALGLGGAEGLGGGRVERGEAGEGPSGTGLPRPCQLLGAGVGKAGASCWVAGLDRGPPGICPRGPRRGRPARAAAGRCCPRPRLSPCGAASGGGAAPGPHQPGPRPSLQGRGHGTGGPLSPPGVPRPRGAAGLVGCLGRVSLLALARPLSRRAPGWARLAQEEGAPGASSGLRGSELTARVSIIPGSPWREQKPLCPSQSGPRELPQGQERKLPCNPSARWSQPPASPLVHPPAGCWLFFPF